MKSFGIALALVLLGCDGDHCGTRGATDAGPTDGAFERLAANVPDAGTDGDGGISVRGTFNVCPDIFAATASPPSALVRQTIDVSVSAGDRDGDRLTFAWSATTGTFAMPTAAATTYTCASDGAQSLTIKVSDGQCTEMTTVPITCSGARG